MKYIACTWTVVIMVAMMNACTTADASRGMYAWEYDRQQVARDGTVTPLSPVSYTLADQGLCLEDGAETVAVNYRTGKLYRCDTRTRSCRGYDLGPGHSSTQAPLQKNLADSMGQIRVNFGQETREIDTIPCRKLEVWFGGHLISARTAAPITVRQFGRHFTVHSAVYWVADTIPDYHQLLRMGQKRMPVFEAHPLLRRIDPLGLIPLLNGFPVRIEQPGPDGNLIVSTLDNVQIRRFKAARFAPPPGYRLQMADPGK